MIEVRLLSAGPMRPISGAGWGLYAGVGDGREVGDGDSPASGLEAGAWYNAFKGKAASPGKAKLSTASVASNFPASLNAGEGLPGLGARRVRHSEM
jgi:hypothetical protein